MGTTKAQRSALAKARAQGQFIPVNPVLEFKRSTSRGRNTYGYNIVALYVNGVKVASTCGGGYDMKGTVLGDYIQQRFQAELMRLYERAHGEYRQGTPGSYCTHQEDRARLYGLTAAYAKDGILHSMELDGACGFSSMEHILEALGYHLSSMRTHGKGRDIYILAKD